MSIEAVTTSTVYEHHLRISNQLDTKQDARHFVQENKPGSDQWHDSWMKHKSIWYEKPEWCKIFWNNWWHLKIIFSLHSGKYWGFALSRRQQMLRCHLFRRWVGEWWRCDSLGSWSWRKLGEEARKCRFCGCSRCRASPAFFGRSFWISIPISAKCLALESSGPKSIAVSQATNRQCKGSNPRRITWLVLCPPETIPTRIEPIEFLHKRSANLGQSNA